MLLFDRIPDRFIIYGNMGHLFPEAELMLRECDWMPVPDWHYYQQHLAELNLEFHDSIKRFLNTFESLNKHQTNLVN